MWPIAEPQGAESVNAPRERCPLENPDCGAQQVGLARKLNRRPNLRRHATFRSDGRPTHAIRRQEQRHRAITCPLVQRPFPIRGGLVGWHRLAQPGRCRGARQVVGGRSRRMIRGVRRRTRWRRVDLVEPLHARLDGRLAQLGTRALVGTPARRQRERGQEQAQQQRSRSECLNSCVAHRAELRLCVLAP